MFVELLISLLTALLIWDYLIKKRRNVMFKEIGITGPTELPLIGGGYHFIRESPETIFKFLTDFTHRFGKIWRLGVLHECAVIVGDIRLIEAILGSQQVITKMKVYDMLCSWLGTGLLLSTGKKWHSRRKIITPTFHFKILEQFVEIFDQQSAVMAQRLYAKADGKTALNIFPAVCLCTLDIIAETAMGVKVNAQMDPNLPYVKSLTNVAEITSNRFVRPYQRFEGTLRFTSPFTYRKLTQSIEIMHKFTNEVIEERRNTLEKSIVNDSFEAESAAAEDVGTKKRMALLDVSLQSTIGGAPLSDGDIREEVDTFMFEGHDTTTSGISHCLYLLSRHAAVQQKVFEEIRQIIGDDRNQPVTMRDLQELKYLECVIKESLRLYPPVPLIGRYTEQDVVLNGKTYPANTNFVILIYHALRDPDNFTEPNEFIPERFSLESSDRINPFAYVPFSAGPRNCIGQKFAMLEMKSTISKLVRHFELLDLGAEVKPLMNLILRSANGVNLGLRPRI